MNLALTTTYRATVYALQQDNYETAGRVWPDGFGIVAAGHSERGVAQSVIIVATAETLVVAPARQLITALREARMSVLECSERMPNEAAGWLTTIIEQWEKDHPADKPN